MKVYKMPFYIRGLFALGVLLSTCTPFLHQQYPAMPDFLAGSLQGIGIGLLIGVLIRMRKAKKNAADQQAG
jgi:hypothetical protein